MKVKWKLLSRVRLCDTMDYTVCGILQARILEWVAFPFSRGSNPGLPHCRRILYQLRHKGSPRIREWVAYTFSSGSSQPRNWTRVSCIAGRFFTNWAIKKARGWDVKTQPPKPNLVKDSYWWKHLHVTVGIPRMSTFSRSCALLGSSKNLEPIFEYSRPNLISDFL